MEGGSTNSDEKTIMDMPLLVLTKIFRLLGNKDRERAMQTCKHWHYVMNSEVGLTHYVWKRKHALLGHKSNVWRPLSVITTSGIDKCIFGDFEDYEEVHTTSTFLLPGLVRDITFMGNITDGLFHQIMAPVFWLTSLKIHLTVLLNVSFQNSALSHLCSLTHLKIFYTHPVYHLSCPFIDTPSHGREEVHEHLVTLLEGSNFRRIKIFEFVGPYFIEKMENLIDKVREFCKRHEVTLRQLRLEFPYEWNAENKKEYKLVKETGGSSSGAGVTRKEKHLSLDWGKVQLTNIVIVCPATIVPPSISLSVEMNEGHFPSAWGEEKLNPVWHSLLSTQSRLESLRYVNKHERWVFPEAILSKSSDNITSLSLSINAAHPVDCKALANCRNLSKLLLEGNYFHELFQEHLGNENGDGGDSSQDKVSGLFNASHLPESLEEVCLSKLLIPVGEVNIIVSVGEGNILPKLKCLQLYQISKGLPEYGLTPTAAQRLLDATNLSVSFWRALNQPAFKNALDTVSENQNFKDCADWKTIEKIAEYCDEAEYWDGMPDNLQFTTLDDSHVQLIRRKYN